MNGEWSLGGMKGNRQEEQWDGGAENNGNESLRDGRRDWALLDGGWSEFGRSV